MLKMDRAAYEVLVAEDLAWLRSQPRRLERDHVIVIVQQSVEAYYGPAGDCPQAPMPGKAHRRRDNGKCMYCEDPEGA